MKNSLSSWGRYPNYPQVPHAVFWREKIVEEMTGLADKFGSTLPFGQGRSYGDSCLSCSDHVLQTKLLNRFISFNKNTGVIVAESGVTLEQVLSVIIPYGWFLPVTPGTKYVSLGGAVANDVHGKNHHIRGTFGSHVASFGLIRSDGQSMICSPEKNVELFSATIGGLGLTGIISWVELRLLPIRSSNMDMKTVRFNSLSEFFSLSDELDKVHEYSVAWVDCLAKGKNTGRGVFMTADHAAEGDLSVNAKRKLTFPVTLPFSAINKFTLPVLNSAYYFFHKEQSQKATVSYEPFFYPLDGINYWNRAYGKAGFQQYQCVVPEECAKDAINDILAAIAASGTGSFLAVLKRCGSAVSPGLLSFPLPGLSLALDFPQKPGLEKDLFFQLDAIVSAASGRLYPAKDAHMSGEVFRDSYPKWDVVEKLRDPALCSRFWERVTSS